MELLIVFGCLAIIVLASDFLINAASSIAIKLKVSKTLIALTIVSFGTCMPELSISFNSIISNNANIALANVIASCFVNIVLVIGLTCLIRPIRVKDETVSSELPILLFITSVFSILLFNRIFFNENQFLARIDGILLLLMFIIFVIYLVRLSKKNENYGKNIVPQYTLGKAIIIMILSFVAIYISSDLLVANAVKFSEAMGISQKFITMAVISIGTSFPELVMTVMAARKKEFDIAIGNIIGTNIFNICVVLGLPIAILGGVEISGFNYLDIMALAFSSLMLFAFAKSDKTLSKVEGAIMMLMFVTYYLYVWIL